MKDPEFVRQVRGNRLLEGMILIDGKNDGCCDVDGASVGNRLGYSDGWIDMEGTADGLSVGV